MRSQESRVALVACLALTACTRAASREQPKTIDPPASLRTETAATASAAHSGVSGRALVLGRVVDLETMQAVATATPTAPDYELTLAAENLGVAYWTWGDLQAIDLTSGHTRWVTRPTACSGRTLAATTDYLYLICGSDVAAFRLVDGFPSSLGAGSMPFLEFVVNGEHIFARDVTGRVRVWNRVDAHKRLLDKRLPELASGVDEQGLIKAPSMPGICVWGLRGSQVEPAQRRLDVACYDERLARRWTKTIKLGSEPAAARLAVVQTGPYNLVLRDELEPGGAPRAQAQTAVVRWSDGTVTMHDSALFATLERANGERIVDSPALDVFTRGADDRGVASFEHEGAQIIYEHDSAYVLLKRGAAALGAADLAANRTRFVVRVPENNMLDFEAVHGAPIVRFQERAVSFANIYDPLSGVRRYSDGRDQDTRHRAF